MEVTNFRDAVTLGCRELMQEFGFALQNKDESFVYFEGGEVTICFAYDRSRACEVSVEIALKTMQEGNIFSYNLGEVMREFSVPRSNELSYLQSSSTDRIGEFVKDVCDALLEHCTPILKGSTTAFERVRARRAIESKQYTLLTTLNGIRKEVDEAWLTKDYEKYCDLLTGFESVLSDLEKKKLAFAVSR